VPEGLTEDQRFDVAIEILQFIHDRTTAGNNRNGKKWSGPAGRYSEAYAKKKGKSSPVDLVNTREMLGKMQYFKSLSSDGEIVIGFKARTKAERKAEGNILGSYGGDPNPSKARPFLNILKDDVDRIVSEVTDGE